MTTLLTEKDVLAQLKTSRASLNRMKKSGKFPEPFKIGDNSNRWLEEDWIRSRATSSGSRATFGV